MVADPKPGFLQTRDSRKPETRVWKKGAGFAFPNLNEREKTSVEQELHFTVQQLGFHTCSCTLTEALRCEFFLALYK